MFSEAKNVRRAIQLAIYIFEPPMLLSFPCGAPTGELTNSTRAEADMGWFDKGANDASKNKGQQDPNKFDNDKARKDYQAGYKKQQEEQNQKK